VAALAEAVLAATRTDDFRAWVTELLQDLIAVDTTPNADVDVMRRAEGAVFDRIERELAAFALPGARAERRPLNPRLHEHPAYTPVHFTKTEERPEGLPPGEVYRDRANLVYVVPGTGEGAGDGVAVNAHVDVIAPFLPPRVKDGVVFGRGACDDKGSCVAILGALRAIAAVLGEAGERLRKNVVGLFVVEEETGGNGSLSLALDREIKELYDTILILECASNEIFPANRGAVWYKADFACEGVSMLELAMFAVEEMEKEGRALRAESRHPLFPQRPVQTCHGVIGPYGEHPSRINGAVSFRVVVDAAADEAFETLLQDVLDWSVEQYTALYGDFTAIIDPDTGAPKVARHYDLRREEGGFAVDVHGSTGHMGSILENDGAITKMSWMVRALVQSRPQLAALAGGADVRAELAGQEDPARLTLEGGQGFVPTHPIETMMDRFARAAERGADHYLRRLGRAESGADVARVSYDKLHNAAFDGDPDSRAMTNALAAAAAAGMTQTPPVRGWTVSCDARLFASEYPGMPVLTSGPGELRYAHADEEQVRIDDVVTAAGFVALYLLRQTGTVNGE
jgi:acetylornithine deacetylase/succinyl-diaminopimelate desuccinylase-like protein